MNSGRSGRQWCHVCNTAYYTSDETHDIEEMWEIGKAEPVDRRCSFSDAYQSEAPSNMISEADMQYVYKSLGVTDGA